MANAVVTADAAGQRSLDESLWWDSFVSLLGHLEKAPLSPDLDDPSLASKLKSNHSWFLDIFSRFKPPNESSRSALDSPQIALGPHRVIVRSDLKEKALRASSYLCLDEVQSYILIRKFVEHNEMVLDCKDQEFLHLILLEYHLERQCLLKCIREILMLALSTEITSQESNVITIEALQLVRDGLERRLISLLQDLLSFPRHEQTDANLTTLWVEETLIEINLVLDVLFLAYYETFCSCGAENWKSLCLMFKEILSGSFNIGKLTASVQARNLLFHVKVQLLLVLVEALDLESLLHMIHDDLPYRESQSVFSFVDIQEMDALISSFNASEMLESGPLILAWAVFLRLILSLPEEEEYNILKEIDHIGYARQSIEARSLEFLFDILCNDILMDPDGPVSGFLSVLRTFISSFVASYDMTHQFIDNSTNVILDILCKIYGGEETLCLQFWDKDSVVDGPIRSILCLFESEFPFHIVELTRLLSALCGGPWSAQCVYNFLDNMGGVTTMFEIGDSSMENISDAVETCHPLLIPGIEGLQIPPFTHGQILKVVDGSTVLVRWVYPVSGVLLLVLRLAQGFDSISYEEVLSTLDLIHQIVSFNMGLCFALMGLDDSSTMQAARINGFVEKDARVDMVAIVCGMACKLVLHDGHGGALSLCISILAKMLKCSPSYVVKVVSSAHIFGMGDVTLRGAGIQLFSGNLSRMLLADCEQNEDAPLTISVLEFTLVLVEIGVDDSIVSPLVLFCVQYVLVNHEHWRYKSKHVRWKVTLEVFELMRKCIKEFQNIKNIGRTIQDVLLNDLSIANTLCRIMCITSQSLERLFVSHIYELKVIKGLENAVFSALDITYSLLDISKDNLSGLPVFHQVMLSSSTKPIPLFSAVVSLVSYSRNSVIQIAAAKVLSVLCNTAAKVQPYLTDSICLVSEDLQIRSLSASVHGILDVEATRNEDLFVAVIEMLTSVALYQPAFFISISSTLPYLDDKASNTQHKDIQLLKAPALGSLSSMKTGLFDSVMQALDRSRALFDSGSPILLSVLKLLKTLWQGAAQYISILEIFRNSGVFWKKLSSCFLALDAQVHSSIESLNGDDILHSAYRFKCQAMVLEIMAYDMFLQRKMTEDEIPESGTNEQPKGSSEQRLSARIADPNNPPGGSQDILSNLCESSIMGSLIQQFSSCDYRNKFIFQAKIAVSLCIVDLIGKVSNCYAGSLSLPLVEKIYQIFGKLREQPAFSSLLEHYSLYGYSEGKELTNLVLNDFYYHLQGELEGREISPGPFKELSKYLLQLELFKSDDHDNEGDNLSNGDVYLYDIPRMQADFALELWHHSDWKASKMVAENMLQNMRDANVINFLADSKLSALKALTSAVSVYEGNSIKKIPSFVGSTISRPLVQTCIGHLCKAVQELLELITLDPSPSKELVDFLVAQTELLLNLSRFMYRQLSVGTSRETFLSDCVLLIKTSSNGLRILNDIRKSTTVVSKAVKLFLLLLLCSVEFGYAKSQYLENADMDVDLYAEVSLISLGLLPVLCNCSEMAEYCNLSVAAMNVLLNSYLTPSTWLPVLQKHLQLQIFIRKLHQKESHVSLLVILKFLLTLARIKGGAELLRDANFFSSLRILFSLLLDDKAFTDNEECGSSGAYNKEEKIEHIWGLGLAIVTAMICSLGDDSSCFDIVGSAIPYFFAEKGHIMSYYLTAPDFPSNDHNKRWSIMQKSRTSLMALRGTKQSLMLICVLAKHRTPWMKHMKEMEKELRERCIHFLAFISRGVQHIGESRNRMLSFQCLPILKEEVEDNGRPSFMNSRRGWFAFSALGISAKTSVPVVSRTALSPLIKDNANVDSIHQTCFSDAVAIEVYRITFLLLKFLCMQAMAASKRAEDVEFIDLAHFPELPMPEILHGIQDQATCIVTEVCSANKSKTIKHETQDVCVLLLQILEMSLYIEFCVSQICGIRPVSGRIEDFSKEIKQLMQATEGHKFLESSLRSLKQLLVLVYPGLVQVEGIF